MLAASHRPGPLRSIPVAATEPGARLLAAPADWHGTPEWIELVREAIETEPQQTSVTPRDPVVGPGTPSTLNRRAR